MIENKKKMGIMKEKIKTPYLYFFSLEEKMNLFNLEYMGVHYWQLIRFNILKIITMRKQTVINQNRKTNKWSLISRTLKNACKQIIISKNLVHSDVVILRPESTYLSTKEINEKEFDYFSLGMFTKLDIFLLDEYSSNNKFRVYDASIPELFFIIWKIWNRITGYKMFDDVEVIKIFLDEVNREYETDIQLEAVISQIIVECFQFKIYKEWYKKIFSKLTPNIILLSTHYNKRVFPAISLAKDLDIKTIEIQHGRINSHEAYYYIDQSNTGKYLPDFLFTYGEWWNHQIQMPECVKPIAVGNPFLEFKVNPNHSNDGVILSVFSGPQTGIVLSKLIMECSGFFKDNNIQVIYKIHPCELLVWEREYPWLSQTSNIKIIDDPRTSVYDLLNKSSHVLAVNSTVLFEATVYDRIKILIYDKEDIDPMIPLIKMQYATIIHSADDLINVLKSREPLHSVVESKNVFYKSHASTNTEKAITSIYSIASAGALSPF